MVYGQNQSKKPACCKWMLPNCRTALKNQPAEFVYRYSSLPIELTLNVKTILPLITVEQWIEIDLQPEKINLELAAIYDIQAAGVFQLNLDIPTDFEIREIRGPTRDGLHNIPVETFYRDSKNNNQVIVTLQKKALGKLGLLVSLDRELDDANLLTPTETAAELPIKIPTALRAGLEFSQGHVVVYAPESLTVNVTDTQGLRTDSFQEALKNHRTNITALQTAPPTRDRCWRSAFLTPMRRSIYKPNVASRKSRFSK